MDLKTGSIITLAISLTVLAAIIPSAISDIEATNTTGWSTATTALWGIFGVVIVAALLLALLPSMVYKPDKRHDEKH